MTPEMKAKREARMEEMRKRREAMEKRAEEWKEWRAEKKEEWEKRKATIEERRKARREELKQQWGDLAKNPAARAELKTHAERMAKLERARRLADEEKKPELIERIDKLVQKERERHYRAMARIEEKMQGGSGDTKAEPKTEGAKP